MSTTKPALGHTTTPLLQSLEPTQVPTTSFVVGTKQGLERTEQENGVPCTATPQVVACVVFVRGRLGMQPRPRLCMKCIRVRCNCLARVACGCCCSPLTPRGHCIPHQELQDLRSLQASTVCVRCRPLVPLSQRPTAPLTLLVRPATSRVNACTAAASATTNRPLACCPPRPHTHTCREGLSGPIPDLYSCPVVSQPRGRPSAAGGTVCTS